MKEKAAETNVRSSLIWTPRFLRDRRKVGSKNCNRLSRSGMSFCRERQKMQKRSRKLQSLQHKKKCLEDAGMCDEEMERVRDEITEREALLKSWRTSRRNVVWKQVIWRSQAQPLRCTIHSEEKEETKLRKSKGKGRPAAKWVHQRQEASMKGLQLVLCLIQLGIRMQTVKAVEETSKHQGMDRKTVTDLVLLAGISNNLRRMESFEQPGKGPKNPKKKQPG